MPSIVDQKKGIVSANKTQIASLEKRIKELKLKEQ